MALPDCTEEELQALYEWVDSVPLSRPKKSITRDFADGVLMAELVHYFFPKLVEVHNYSPAHNSVQKMYNWTTLNQKVFRRMGFALAREHCEAVANAEAGAVERVLKLLLAAGALGHPAAAAAFPTLDQALHASLADKEQQLEELRETNQILETKISKLEQLVRLKDAKVQALLARLAAAEAPPAAPPAT
ncbi:hypothetical protein CHLNCDRAFT_49012 [Chlorella variabilis]|uniref:Calponin-homology (CH) domain-containing protein n=1 Tax=Chlorella variabilis TaxID=554065 RepID=E1ZL26_CHLVA|nr:hypothetical protein CHLNCDRAFT_49012 [Chlorella variabilis]EFN53489.1 hypothetical protein CHLNCDRAFT_49012 [Chlorella variabilis]|eukprot:XP_005845591.1 hypothetical protein CHLNCDRAFT_49012 [Chlorella variabilis]